MMKSRLSLRNLVRAARNSLLLIIPLLVFGCTSSTTPTYTKETMASAIQSICKQEYKIDVTSRLVGDTLWVYLPVEDFFEKNDKPEKYTEKYNIEAANAAFANGNFNIDYSIKLIKATEKTQDIKYNKKVLEKINNVWAVLRRVVFSLNRKNTGEPKFFCMVTADIKNGFDIKETFYYLDLKRVSYDLISWGEYRHRAIQDTNVAVEIIGDKKGEHLNYKEIKLADFIAEQIKQRIRLKFEKTEVEPENVDVDKEVGKIVSYTIKTYGFKDFSAVELNNLLTKNKTILNEAAIWAKPIEKRF